MTFDCEKISEHPSAVPVSTDIDAEVACISKGKTVRSLKTFALILDLETSQRVQRIHIYVLYT
jgi:hypothetical protein